MLFLFKRRHREWKLKYTFVYQSHEVQEYDRFLTREEAEERFRTMSEYHHKQQQPIVRAQLTGPKGFQKDLTPIIAPYQNQARR